MGTTAIQRSAQFCLGGEMPLHITLSCSAPASLPPPTHRVESRAGGLAEEIGVRSSGPPAWDPFPQFSHRFFFNSLHSLWVYHTRMAGKMADHRVTQSHHTHTHPHIFTCTQKDPNMPTRLPAATSRQHLQLYIPLIVAPGNAQRALLSAPRPP